MSNLLSTVFFLLALVISISIHECAHAWSANELGDSTARRMGRLTLNPIAHFDPIGALMIVFMAFAGWGIGWGKPVPVNPYNLRTSPRVGMGLTAAAGPFSNLALAALSAIPLRLLAGSLPASLSMFLVVMVYTNVGLALFNLIPLPPLDGFSVLQGILGTFRARWAHDLGGWLDRIAPFGPMLLMAMLALGWFTAFNPLSVLLGPAREALVGLFLG